MEVLHKKCWNDSPDTDGFTSVGISLSDFNITDKKTALVAEAAGANSKVSGGGGQGTNKTRDVQGHLWEWEMGIVNGKEAPIWLW